jgi:hypothetical protein
MKLSELGNFELDFILSFSSVRLETIMNSANQAHWIYHPKIRAILNTADVGEEEDGLAEFSGLDASGAKALLGLLEHLDPESLKQTHNASPTQQQLLETCII